MDHSTITLPEEESGSESNMSDDLTSQGYIVRDYAMAQLAVKLSEDANNPAGLEDMQFLSGVNKVYLDAPDFIRYAAAYHVNLLAQRLLDELKAQLGEDRFEEIKRQASTLFTGMMEEDEE